MIRFYKVTIQSAHFCRHYSLVATASWFTAKAEWGLSVDCCFLLVSSMFSLSIPFLLCPGDGLIYEILRDNQLTNQSFRGFNFCSLFYSIP